MQDNGDGDDNGGNGGDGDGAVSAPPNTDDGYMAVPRFDAKDFDKHAGPVFARLGHPKDAKGYTFADPKDFQFNDVDKEYRESFRAVAHRARLTQGQAAILHDWQVGNVKLMRDAERAGRQEGSKKSRAQLQKDWGNEFDGRLASAQEALNHYAGRDADALARTVLADGSVLGDKIEFVRAMANIGKSAPPPKAAGSREEAQAEIDGILRAAERDNIGPGHPKWHLVDAQLEPLYAKVHGTKRKRTDGLRDE
jgi:hypothetical protein